VKYRTYVLKLEGPPDVLAFLKGRVKEEYAGLGEAREVSGAVETLFPAVRTRIVSAQTKGTRIVKVLKG